MEVITHDGIVDDVHASEVSDAGLYVRVRIVQGAACSACQARSVCMAAETAVKYVDAVAARTEKLARGDEVTVEVSKRLGWKAVLIAFVLPFVLMMTVLSLLVFAGVGETWAGLSAMAALVPYYALVYCFRDRLKAQYRFVARRRVTV